MAKWKDEIPDDMVIYPSESRRTSTASRTCRACYTMTIAAVFVFVIWLAYGGPWPYN